MAASAGAIVLGIVTAWHGVRSMQGLREARDFPGDGLDKIGFRLAGEARGETVFIGDIGVVGWHSGLRVYDFAGLVTPEAINSNRKRSNYNGRINIDYQRLLAQIERVRPEFVVLADYMPFRAETVSAPDFREWYDVAMRAGENTLYKRRGAGANGDRRIRHQKGDCPHAELERRGVAAAMRGVGAPVQLPRFRAGGHRQRLYRWERGPGPDRSSHRSR